MANDQHRRSIRLPHYDYRETGAYFVTICTFQRECILDDERLKRAVYSSWRGIGGSREPWEFVVMPNHVHGLVWIRRRSPVGAQHLATTISHADQNDNEKASLWTDQSGAAPLQGLDVAPWEVLPGSLGAIVRAFKSASTRRINKLRRTPGAPIWQRNYYERVVRDGDELERIREYIRDNPAKWQDDPNHPSRLVSQTTRPSSPAGGRRR